MPRMKANRLPNMLAFNGSSDFMTLPIVPSGTGFNLAFWAIKRNHTSSARVIDCQESGPTRGVTVYEDTNYGMRIGTRDNIGTNGFLLGKGIPNAKLVHYVFTFDGTNLKNYENGILIGTDTSSTMVASNDTFTVAKRNGGTNYWNGKLGELVFINTATPWTQEQITDLYYNGLIPSGASYWLFDGNVLDGSGNGNHGTLTGGTYIDRDATRAVATRSAVL